MSQVVRGQAPPVPGAPVLYASDGSAVRTKSRKMWNTGFGWLCTDGRYMVGMCPIPTDQIGRDPYTVTELRGIYHAVKARNPAKGMVLLVDSTTALGFLDAWAGGDTSRMPADYVGSINPARTPMLHRLADLIAAEHHMLAWSHVKGHNGHLLNEAADSLAKIGREWSRGTYNDVQAAHRAQWLAEGFLADRRLLEAVA